MEEIWKNIRGYSGVYRVSNNGNVLSLQKGNKVLKPGIIGGGYCMVGLFKNGKRKNLLVHRLVAEAFIPNPRKKKTVNHIDGNTKNNRVENLEWCSYGENHKHAYVVLNRKAPHEGKVGELNHNSKKVAQISSNGKTVKVWESAGCAKRAGFSSGKISECCNGYAKTHKGFSWRYL